LFIWSLERINELEIRRIKKLDAYLEVCGLKDIDISPLEEKALEDLNNLEFGEFKVTDVFEVENTGNILGRDIVANSGTTPYLSARKGNNSVSSYISYDKSFLDKGDCIFIGGKTFVVTYQEYDFFSNDSHNLVLYHKDADQKKKLTQFYLATCINKSLGYKYSWGDSISKKKIQTDNLSLPISKGKVDYSQMATLISAIQKLVIMDVANYTDRKIQATKEVVNKNCKQ